MSEPAVGRRRIGLVVGSLRGGVGTWSRALAGGLPEAGFDVDLVALDRDGALAVRARLVDRLPRSGPVLAAKALESVIRTRWGAPPLVPDPDWDALLVANGGHPGDLRLLRLVLDRGGWTGPVALVVHSAARRRYVPFAEAARDRAIRLAGARVVTVANALLPPLAARGFGAAVAIPNGVPEPTGGADRTAARRALGIAESGAPVAVALGGLVPEKQIDLLLAAWTAAAEPGLLLVAGDGPERRRLERIAGPSVRFLGQVDAAAVLGAADFLVSASAAEGLPNSMLEAMAWGLPVIGTDVGAVGDAVIDGVTGTLVPPNDVGALVGALVEMAGDADRRAQLGAAGRARQDSHFRADRMVGAYAALLRSLLA